MRRSDREGIREGRLASPSPTGIVPHRHQSFESLRPETRGRAEKARNFGQRSQRSVEFSRHQYAPRNRRDARRLPAPWRRPCSSDAWSRAYA